jgi:repressor LexA
MNRINELRKKNKYSQQKLAAVLNVHQTAISQWETERTTPDIELAAKMANLFNVSIEYLLGKSDDDSMVIEHRRPKGIKIPVLGIVPAGIPIEAIEDILDYEEIPEQMASTGEFFGLKIRGDSMLPKICDGDVVIVRRQPDVESGETAIIMVNGDEATCKKVVKQENGITLVPNNPAYDPRFFTNKEISSTPVRVIGKVVELRRKF